MERETAMKILKELHDNSLFSNRIALETLIPELADSNDERIRKALLEMVHDTTGDELWVDYNVHKEEALAWLEKQGEEQPIIRWHSISEEPEEMKELFCEWESDDATWHDVAFYDEESKTFRHAKMPINVTKWVYVDELLEKQSEQKPVLDFKASNFYVSKVDGKLHNIYQSVDKIEQKPTSDTKYEVKAGGSLSANGQPFDYEHATITQKDFAPINVTDEGIVEAIKNTSVLDMIEQKPAWSEEDENIAEDLIEGLLSSEKIHHLAHTSKEISDWLKSIKDRLSWKPSEEQIHAFEQLYEWYNNNFCPSETLTSLYNDLKKL